MDDDYIVDFPTDYEFSLCNPDNTSTECDPIIDVMSLEKKIKDLDSLINSAHSPGPCPTDDSDRVPCDQRLLHKLLLGYLFPLVFTLCVFGNGANVLTYSGKYLRTSTTVKMLTAKAVLNTVFMICLTPHFFLLILDADGSGRGLLVYYLWASWPYVLFIANISGTSAMW